MVSAFLKVNTNRCTMTETRILQVISKSPCLRLSRTSLLFRANRNSFQKARIIRVDHKSMVENAVHLWCHGQSMSATLGRIDYNRGVYVPSTLPGCKSAIDNIPCRPTTIEKLYTANIGNTLSFVGLKRAKKVSSSQNTARQIF